VVQVEQADRCVCVCLDNMTFEMKKLFMPILDIWYTGGIYHFRLTWNGKPDWETRNYKFPSPVERGITVTRPALTLGGAENNEIAAVLFHVVRRLNRRIQQFS